MVVSPHTAPLEAWTPLPGASLAETEEGVVCLELLFSELESASVLPWNAVQ